MDSNPCPAQTPKNPTLGIPGIASTLLELWQPSSLVSLGSVQQPLREEPLPDPQPKHPCYSSMFHLLLSRSRSVAGIYDCKWLLVHVSRGLMGIFRTCSACVGNWTEASGLEMLCLVLKASLPDPLVLQGAQGSCPSLELCLPITEVSS